MLLGELPEQRATICSAPAATGFQSPRQRFDGNSLPCFSWEGSPTKIDYRKKGSLILTSLLEYLAGRVAELLEFRDPKGHDPYADPMLDPPMQNPDQFLMPQWCIPDL